MTTFAQIRLHVVFSTKLREPWLQDERLDPLYSYMGGIAHHRGATLMVAGGVSDHVHLLFDMPTDVAPANLMCDVKAISSRWFRETFDVDAFEWQRGYSVFSVSASLVPRVTAYIKNQTKLLT